MNPPAPVSSSRGTVSPYPSETAGAEVTGSVTPPEPSRGSVTPGADAARAATAAAWTGPATEGREAPRGVTAGLLVALTTAADGTPVASTAPSPAITAAAISRAGALT